MIFSLFPLTIGEMKKKGNVIFFLNRRCTVGCASCNAGAVAAGGKELSPSWLEAFFQRLPDHLFSGYIIWTGGEPFLSPEALQAGIALASRRGFRSEILTSGVWFTERPGLLDNLKSAGDFTLRISLDAEHQQRVPLPHIIALIKKGLDLHIEVNFTLREIPGKKNTAAGFQETIQKELPEFYRRNHHRSRWLHRLPHMPIAPEKDSDGAVPNHSHGGKWRGRCRLGFTDVVIGEDGLLYPCCGLFGASGHEKLAIGDPLTETWETLENRQQEAPLFKLLKEKGPYGVCREMNLTPETWPWPPYQSACDICLAMFYSMPSLTASLTTLPNLSP